MIHNYLHWISEPYCMLMLLPLDVIQWHLIHISLFTTVTYIKNLAATDIWKASPYLCFHLKKAFLSKLSRYLTSLVELKMNNHNTRSQDSLKSSKQNRRRTKKTAIKKKREDVRTLEFTSSQVFIAPGRSLSGTRHARGSRNVAFDSCSQCLILTVNWSKLVFQY